MPTGYTADVMDGKVTDLKDFAMQAARGMGVFIHMRDDGTTAELRYPEPPSDHYRKTYDEYAAKFDEWTKMDEHERYAKWSEYARETTVHLHESIAESSVKRARYESMLAQVHAVDVPAKLSSFKDFMVEQLESSIDFDCGKSDRFERDYYKVMDYYDWCDDNAKTYLRMRDTYKQHVIDEERRYRERCEYVDLLVETFGFEVKK